MGTFRNRVSEGHQFVQAVPVRPDGKAPIALAFSGYNRTQDEQRFSPLTAVNETSVKGLAPAWTYKMPTTRGHEATPLVHDGIMYVTSAWSVLHAIDARTGEEKWIYDPQVPKAHARFACCDVVNRGAALYRGKV